MFTIPKLSAFAHNTNTHIINNYLQYNILYTVHVLINHREHVYVLTGSFISIHISNVDPVKLQILVM